MELKFMNNAKYDAATKQVKLIKDIGLAVGNLDVLLTEDSIQDDYKNVIKENLGSILFACFELMNPLINEYPELEQHIKMSDN